MSFFSLSSETQLRLVLAGLLLAGCGAGGGGGTDSGGFIGGAGNDVTDTTETDGGDSPAHEAGEIVAMNEPQAAVFAELASLLGQSGKTPPRIRYQHATRCEDGSICCLANYPQFGGYYHEDTRTIDLVVPEEAESICPHDEILRHESIHDLTHNYDHTHPAFCLYSQTCCPTLESLIGECAPAPV